MFAKWFNFSSTQRVYMLFVFPLCLLVQSKGFPCVSWTFLLPAVVFSGLSLGGWSCGSLAAPSVPLCPAGCAPAVPSAVVPPVSPHPYLSLPWGWAVALELLSVDTGRLVSALVPAQCGKGEQMNLVRFWLLGQGVVESLHLRH